MVLEKKRMHCIINPSVFFPHQSNPSFYRCLVLATAAAPEKSPHMLHVSWSKRASSIFSNHMVICHANATCRGRHTLSGGLSDGPRIEAI